MFYFSILQRKVLTPNELPNLSAVQTNIMVPLNEMAAVVKGVRAGMEFLFARRRHPTVTETTQDEQLFI